MSPFPADVRAQSDVTALRSGAQSMNQNAPPPPYEVAAAADPVASGYTGNQSLGNSAASSEFGMAHSRQSTGSSRDSLRGSPVAIPATSPDLGSPFLRAYPPALEHYQISKELFLKFLDDLNRVAVKNPPLQVLSLAGTIVGFVPLATAQIVGTAVNAAASVGTVALSKGRTEMFLRDANRTIFGPRGLKCEIAKLEVVAKVAGIPILNESGKIDKKSSLLKPIDDLELSRTMSGHERRLQVLEPYVARLEVTPLPDIDVPSNPLSKWSVRASEHRRRKDEEDMSESRDKAHSKHKEEIEKIEEDFAKEMRKLDKEEEKARREKSPKKEEEELRKVEKERRKVAEKYEKEMGKADKDRRKDDKEEKEMTKILFVLIRHLEDDSGSGENADVPEMS